jgi:hypothetical protein
MKQENGDRYEYSYENLIDGSKYLCYKRMFNKGMEDTYMKRRVVRISDHGKLRGME